MSTDERERKGNSDDEAVLQLAQRLAPRASDIDADGPVPFRKSGPSSFLILLLLVAALMPSLGLATIVISSPELKQSMWTETRQAAAIISALTAMLGGTDSRPQKSQAKIASASPDVAKAPSALASSSRSRSLVTPEQAVFDDVLAPPSVEAHMKEPKGGETASLSQRTEAAERESQSGFEQAAEPELQRLIGSTAALEDQLGSGASQSHNVLSELPVEISAAEVDSEPSLEKTDVNPVVVPSFNVDAPEAELVLRPEESARVASLMVHGHKMIEVGYFAGARAYFKRAAEAGSGEAALALGATYDPQFIKEIGAHGIEPEPDEARLWYNRAKLLGAVGVNAKLATLDRESKLAAGSVAQNVKPPPAPTQEQETSSPISASRSDSETPTEIWVQPTGAVNLRKGPSPDSEATQVIRSGTKLRVMANEESWFHVTDPETGTMGWVYSKAVETTSAPDPMP